MNTLKRSTLKMLNISAIREIQVKSMVRKGAWNPVGTHFSLWDYEKYWKYIMIIVTQHCEYN